MKLTSHVAIAIVEKLHIYIYVSPLPVLKIFERTSRKLNDIKSDSVQDTTIPLAQSSTLDWVDR